jgi:hypothetical protein
MGERGETCREAQRERADQHLANDRLLHGRLTSVFVGDVPSSIDRPSSQCGPILTGARATSGHPTLFGRQLTNSSPSTPNPMLLRRTLRRFLTVATRSRGI